jgi:hypothetical protein
MKEIIIGTGDTCIRHEIDRTSEVMDILFHHLNGEYKPGEGEIKEEDVGEVYFKITITNLKSAWSFFNAVENLKRDMCVYLGQKDIINKLKKLPDKNI